MSSAKHLVFEIDILYVKSDVLTMIITFAMISLDIGSDGWICDVR